MNNTNTYFSNKDILIDVLTSIKSLANLYHNLSVEASNDLVFDISSDLREEIFDEGHRHDVNHQRDYCSQRRDRRQTTDQRVDPV